MTMRDSARIRIVMLALMLAVSHIALISHVTAHFQPEFEQCELCVSQSQLLSAIPSPDHHVAVDFQAGSASFQIPQRVIAARHCLAYHQRAPPSLFS